MSTKTMADRPLQPWERNFSGGRIGVQEQQGANENWMILHVKSGGVKTTTSLRLHEAWALARMISPQLEKERQRAAARIAQLEAERDNLIKLGGAINTAADGINGEIDAQTYDEKRKLRDWEDDQRWEIVVNAGEERALNKALCAWQSYVRALAQRGHEVAPIKELP